MAIAKNIAFNPPFDRFFCLGLALDSPAREAPATPTVGAFRASAASEGWASWDVATPPATGCSSPAEPATAADGDDACGAVALRASLLGAAMSSSSNWVISSLSSPDTSLGGGGDCLCSVVAATSRGGTDMDLAIGACTAAAAVQWRLRALGK